VTKDSMGNLRTVGQLLDVTERKQAEQQLAIFKALTENAADAIAMADLEGRVAYGNPAFYRLLVTSMGGII